MEEFPNYHKNDLYFNRYIKFIKHCQTRHFSEIYRESHHIVPKSFGGSNSFDNLILLTYREHFIAHLLLAKAFPYTNIGITLYFFIHGSKRNSIIKTSRAFEFAKRSATVIDTVWFNDGNINYRLPKEVGEQLGHKPGRISTDIWKQYRFVNKNGKNYQIHYNELEEYINNGYNKGQIKKKTIAVTDGYQNTSVVEDVLQEFLRNNPNWMLGHITKSPYRKKDNVVRMHKDDKEQNVLKEEIDQYIKEGWVRGRSKLTTLLFKKAANQIYNGDVNKRVSDEELVKYLNSGWKLGVPEKQKHLNRTRNIGVKIMHNIEGKEIRAKIEDVEVLQSKGWILGRHQSVNLKIKNSKNKENNYHK